MTFEAVKKPYNQCLRCGYQEKGVEKCDGPRTSSMPIDRWREFMRDLKEVKHLTYEEIAARTHDQLSVKTVQSALSPSAHGDINRETARLIENALFASSGQYPCYLAFEQLTPIDARKVAEAEGEMAELRHNIELIHNSYNEELVRVREEAQKKIDYLKLENERKDKIIDRLLAR